MKRNRLGIIRERYDLRPISIMRIGEEIVKESPTVQSVQVAHSNMTTGLKVVGFGLLGLFTIHQFTKDDNGEK